MLEKLKKFFKLEENGTTWKKELVAGATTFFTMAYIMFVNPEVLHLAGIPAGAVFLATIFATVIGTLIMGLFANVPYALAPGMGLNAFFTYTICMGLKFSWQAALAMVFICGIINILITVTKVRKLIIKAIPKSLQYAISGGIGVFIAYIGFMDAGWIALGAVPSLTNFANAATLLALFGLILMIALLIFKVKGAILIGIVATTILSIIVNLISGTFNFTFSFTQIGSDFGELGSTFGACFTQGFTDLFTDASKLPIVILAIFAFSLSDTFDTIGTFIGTGRKSGIFSEEDEKALETSTGFKSKMDKALFADSIATSIGAVLGTSNTTTYIESASGIEAGGRTGFTSVITAGLFLLCIILSPIVGLVPMAATAPALIVVGVMMMSAFKEIHWDIFDEAVPAFFAAILMALCYNISMGIAFGFIFYVIIKLCTKKIKEVHPILLGSAILFAIYFVFMALQGAGILFV